MNLPNDFLAKRLAAIEEEKARRLVAMEEEKAAQAHADRFNRVVSLIVDCVKNMRLARLSEKEIADLLHTAADELDQ